MTVAAFDADPNQRARARQGFQTAAGVLGNLGVPDRSEGGEIAIAETLAPCVAGADLVVETVPEKLDLKIEVFRAVEALVGKDCVLASDTSGIPITKIQDGVAVPDQVLAEIAATVRGGMRDAETALERVLPIARELGDKFDLAAWHELVQRTGAERSLEVVGALLRGEAAAAMHFAAELQQNGADEREALGELVETLRSLLLLQVDGPDTGLVTATGAVRAQLQALAAAAQPQQIDAMIQAAVLGRDRLRRLEDRGVVLELTLVRMAQAGTLPLLADLLAELRAGTAGPVPAPAARPAGALPRPAATPASSAPAAAAGADLRTRVLARIADKPLLHATLELCRIQGPDPQHKVVLTLDSDRKLHRDRLAAPPVRQQVTALIQDVVGRKVTVDFQLGAPAAEAVPPVVPPGPATRAAIERFGGRVVATDPAERVRREAGDTGSKEAGSSDADPEPAPPAPDDGDR